MYSKLTEAEYLAQAAGFLAVYYAVAAAMNLVAAVLALGKWRRRALGLVWLAIALITTKALHELGHALACKHYGGECHELGLMLLVFTPCLYCNVSDSWMLPSKYQRAFIGFAGMYVEIFLASIATFIWWYSDPSGVLSNVCLRVMFISSVSTLLFNGNPLLRFDGYYVFSDAIEIPNLATRAARYYGYLVRRHLLGVDGERSPVSAAGPSN